MTTVDDFTETYAGRRRANEDGTRLAVCVDPAGHEALERNPAQEWRLPAQVQPGCCRWCNRRLP